MRGEAIHAKAMGFFKRTRAADPDIEPPVQPAGGLGERGDVMATHQRLTDWEEHGMMGQPWFSTCEPSLRTTAGCLWIDRIVLHTRAIVKTHRWSGFVVAD